MKKKTKNIKVGKNKFLVFFIILFFSINIYILNYQEGSKFLEGNFIEIKNGVTPILKINNQDTSGSLIPVLEDI